MENTLLRNLSDKYFEYILFENILIKDISKGIEQIVSIICNRGELLKKSILDKLIQFAFIFIGIEDYNIYSFYFNEFLEKTTYNYFDFIDNDSFYRFVLMFYYRPFDISFYDKFYKFSNPCISDDDQKLFFPLLNENEISEKSPLISKLDLYMENKQYEKTTSIMLLIAKYLNTKNFTFNGSKCDVYDFLFQIFEMQDKFGKKIKYKNDNLDKYIKWNIPSLSFILKILTKKTSYDLEKYFFLVCQTTNFFYGYKVLKYSKENFDKNNKKTKYDKIDDVITKLFLNEELKNKNQSISFLYENYKNFETYYYKNQNIGLFDKINCFINFISKNPFVKIETKNILNEIDQVYFNKKFVIDVLSTDENIF